MLENVIATHPRLLRSKPRKLPVAWLLSVVLVIAAFSTMPGSARTTYYVLNLLLAARYENFSWLRKAGEGRCWWPSC